MPSLISPCRCLSAKTSCHMQNACIAIGAICQRALRPLFTALCPLPASEIVGNSIEHAFNGRISDLYFFLGNRRKVWKREGVCGGCCCPVASPPQAIKRSYGMNTTLIQSQLLILDYFLAERISWMGRTWWLWWIKAAKQDKNKTAADRGRKWGYIYTAYRHTGRCFKRGDEVGGGGQWNVKLVRALCLYASALAAVEGEAILFSWTQCFDKVKGELWHGRSPRLRDHLIRFWWSKVKGQFNSSREKLNFDLVKVISWELLREAPLDLPQISTGTLRAKVKVFVTSQTC